MAAPTATRKQIEKRVRTLRERLEAALRKQQDDLCDVILEELETLEPDNVRWPHRRGDVLRKQASRQQEAVHCYSRAVALYATSGFLPRAIAMAKVVLELDPQRVDVLEGVDPRAARLLHRRLRPEGVQVADVASPTTHKAVEEAAAELVPDRDAPPDEVRFSAPPPARRTLEIELTEEELVEPEHGQGARHEPVHVMDADAVPEPPPDEGAAESAREAERQACLPLLPLLAEAPREALQRLTREAELLRVAPGQIVVRRGDPADALFGIVEGSVRVTIPGLADDEQPRLSAGEIFGEACLLGNEPRRADVRAHAALTALRIPKQTLTELVRLHPGLGDVLFELLTRRLLANLLRTSPLFAELSPLERRAVAGEFELRRARAGIELVVVGKQSDALFITLTGHVELAGPATETRMEGPGLMFGHASMLEGSPSTLGVRTLDTLLVLRLPRQAFARVAMQYPAMLMRLADLEAVARVGQ